MSYFLDQDGMEALHAVKQLLLELKAYGSTHPVQDFSVGNIEALIASGALSPRTAAFIASPRVRFHGFSPTPIRADTPVLEVALAGTGASGLVGFRDGHVEILESNQPPNDQLSAAGVSISQGAADIHCVQCGRLLARAEAPEGPCIPPMEEVIASGAVLVPNFGVFCSQECGTRYEQSVGKSLFYRNAAGKIDYYSSP